MYNDSVGNSTWYLFVTDKIKIDIDVTELYKGHKNDSDRI